MSKLHFGDASRSLRLCDPGSEEITPIPRWRGYGGATTDAAAAPLASALPALATALMQLSDT
ncbi:uncharacterized protein N7511_008912 [Penicillium nucicola]|uniref:uncharacterized protein n=1 Tax=Penicillium nucicola TaxID=1850975 RepID=UPI0025452326|nr:uncharacterized protein N7511_008912 [Penicillium nucicola]KAJ5747216.1 hypothetical protein N7511_008912 [Penicillium nucicola]